MTRIDHRQLHPAIGTEVLGIDLSRPLEAEAAAQMVKLWEERSVLLFRGQDLSDEDQIRATGYFGRVRDVEFKDLAERKHNGTHPAVAIISNITLDGKPIGTAGDGELWFHSDHCYLEKSGGASMLYGIETTSEGGDTLFASGYAAYEALAPDIKVRLDGVMAEFLYDRELNMMMRLQRPRAEHSKRAVHPAVVQHPATGRPALFVNRLMTTKLIGLDAAESEALLEYLFDFQERPEFIYDHKWQPGDLVVWDNRSCLHSRTEFDPRQRRLMRRTATAGQVLPAWERQAAA